MKLVPIYLNPSTRGYSWQDQMAQATLRWIGIRGHQCTHEGINVSKCHSFRMEVGGVQVGIVMAPDGSTRSVGKAKPFLSVPVDGETINLSAKDVADQASVEGCGLSWAKSN